MTDLHAVLCDNCGECIDTCEIPGCQETKDHEAGRYCDECREEQE